jgi:hypothetical protein
MMMVGGGGGSGQDVVALYGKVSLCPVRRSSVVEEDQWSKRWSTLWRAKTTALMMMMMMMMIHDWLLDAPMSARRAEAEMEEKSRDRDGGELLDAFSLSLSRNGSRVSLRSWCRW